MATKTQEMLQQALEAFVQRDLALARAVHAEDDKVDALYNRIYRQGLTSMRGKSRTIIKQARHLLQVTRNLERAADRVTNICEWVVFAKGEMLQAADQTTDLYKEVLV